MGLRIGLSSCSGGQCGTTQNPNPRKFKILESGFNERFTILKVKYEGCTNYEGVKILVYKGHILKELTNAAELDPHFCENHLSPIARFAPTEEGLTLALNLK